MTRGLALALAFASGALGGAASAAAAPAPLAAIVAAPDVRHAVAIGRDGEIFEPDGHGGWVHRRACTLVAPVVGATHAGDAVLAEVRDGPPFRIVLDADPGRDGSAVRGDAWSVVSLGRHAPHAVLGAGPRPAAAVGAAVFALDGPTPRPLAPAPAPVIALAASPAGVVIETDKGLEKLAGTKWKPMKRAPRHVEALVSDRWGLVERGAVELATGKVIAFPAGARVEATTTAGDALVVVVRRGASCELLVVRGAKLEQDAVPLDRAAVIVGVAADRSRTAIATRDGRILVRDHGTWTTATVRDEIAPPRPGPPPASEP